MAAAGWAMRVLPSLTQLRNAATRPITTPLRAGLCSTYHRRGVYYSLHGATAGGHARRRLCATAAQSQDSAATKAELGGSGPRDGQAGESQGQDAEMPAEVVGRVMTSKANFVTVELDPEVRGSVPHPSLLCNVKSLLKKMQQRVLVGDRVKVVSIDWQDGRGLVGEVIDRQSELLDPPIANVDQVLLVFAASDPALRQFDVTQVTRFLVATEIARIPITVVLNKCDLLPQEEVSRLVAQLGDWGYSAVPISVYAKLGLDALEQTLQGRITVLAGPSGVGKSSIINFVRMKSIAQGYAEEEAGDADGGEGLTQEMLDSLGERVGTVGRTGRGRHTTRHTTLLTLPNGGIVADTPGFNQPALDDFNPSDLACAFPEIRQRMGHGQCTFNDCKHLQEPGCVVRGDWERYPLYEKLLEETEEKYALQVQRSLSKRARQGNIRRKTGAGGQVRSEVLLDYNKHRKSSRKQTKQKFQQDILGDDYHEYD